MNKHYNVIHNHIQQFIQYSVEIPTNSIDYAIIHCYSFFDEKNLHGLYLVYFPYRIPLDAIEMSDPG